jgi:hypothetical protein
MEHGITPDMLQGQFRTLLATLCRTNRIEFLGWMFEWLGLEPAERQRYGVCMLYWACEFNQIETARWVTERFELSGAANALNIGNMALRCLFNTDGRREGVAHWLVEEFGLAAAENAPETRRVLRVAAAANVSHGVQWLVERFGTTAAGALGCSAVHDAIRGAGFRRESESTRVSYGRPTVAIYWLADRFGVDPSLVPPPSSRVLADACAAGSLGAVRWACTHAPRDLLADHCVRLSMLSSACLKGHLEVAEFLGDQGLVACIAIEEAVLITRLAHAAGQRAAAQWVVNRFDIISDSFHGNNLVGIEPADGGPLVKYAAMVA